MPATPDQVRTGLASVTGAAVADLRTVAAAAPKDPAGIRSVLFAATPLIASDYIDSSAVLGLDWFEDLRDAASPPNAFRPRLVATVDEQAISASVAVSTDALYRLEQDHADLTEALLRQATETSMALLEQELQKNVARGFWDTVTTNTDDDPDAVGWQRFARSGACKFCRMLAGKGAVYTRSSVNFAAHGGCHCVVGPSYDPAAPRASVMQYVASQRTRTEKERAVLRAYLNHHFPDAPG